MKIIGLLLILTSFTVLAGGPWTQKKGAGYVQVSASFIPDYSGLYSSGSGGDISLAREISDQTYSLYAEYGLAENFTLSLEAPWKAVDVVCDPLVDKSVGSPLLEGTENGFGNLGVSLKHSFAAGALQMAGQLRIDLNTASATEISGINTGVDTWAVTPALSVGDGSSKFYWFADIGIQIRGDDYSNDLLLGGEAGWLFFERIWLIGALAVRQGVTTGSHDDALSFARSGLYHDNQEFISPGLKLIWEVNDRFGINYARFGAVSGNLVAQRASTTVGLFLKF